MIVGGGYAGTYVAKSLQYDFLVTLVDNKNHFEFTPSKLRTLVQPEHAYQVQVKHKNILPNTNLVCETVQSVTVDTVMTDTQSIPYDYLLICTGARYAVTTVSPSSAPLLVSVRSVHFEVLFEE